MATTLVSVSNDIVVVEIRNLFGHIGTAAPTLDRYITQPLGRSITLTIQNTYTRKLKEYTMQSQPHMTQILIICTHCNSLLQMETRSLHRSASPDISFVNTSRDTPPWGFV